MMKWLLKLVHILCFTVICVAVSNCSHKQVKPLPPTPALEPPPYAKVPQPTGSNLGDVMSLFAEPGAPSRYDFKDCHQELSQLQEKTKNRDEINDGARELIRADAVKQHWCFYSRILKMEEDLKGANFLEDRQRVVLVYYSFLVPMARGFYSEFSDSRYMRVAVARYRSLSEWVFYRRVEPSPEATLEWTDHSMLGFPQQPREPASYKNSNSVFERNGLPKPLPATAPVVPESAPELPTFKPTETPVAPTREPASKSNSLDSQLDSDTTSAIDPSALDDGLDISTTAKNH